MADRDSVRVKRQPFQQRTFRLVDHEAARRLVALIGNLPVDAVRPLEVVIREEKKKRSLDQNSLYWAGPLRDIAEQAWVQGRQYSAEVFHEYLKREYLPDNEDQDFDDTHVKDGYKKWSITPSGERVLIGSTTGLTLRGMSEYLERVYAYGSSLGVEFQEGKRHDQ